MRNSDWYGDWYKILSQYASVNKRLYVVEIGCYEPILLLKEFPMKLAANEAEKAGYNVFVDEGEIITPGQGLMAYKNYFFAKK
jgi:hypothetical protein